MSHEVRTLVEAIRRDYPSVPVVLITYATTEELVRGAVDAIVADGTVAEKPQVIRIERQ